MGSSGRCRRRSRTARLCGPAVCEHELEGVVAKRLREPYRSGDRSWVKIKNRSYWRYELEREGAFRAPRSAETAR